MSANEEATRGYPVIHPSTWFAPWTCQSAQTYREAKLGWFIRELTLKNHEQSNLTMMTQIVGKIVMSDLDQRDTRLALKFIENQDHKNCSMTPQSGWGAQAQGALGRTSAIWRSNDPGLWRTPPTQLQTQKNSAKALRVPFILITGSGRHMWKVELEPHWNKVLLWTLTIFDLLTCLTSISYDYELSVCRDDRYSHSLKWPLFPYSVSTGVAEVPSAPDLGSSFLQNQTWLRERERQKV